MFLLLSGFEQVKASQNAPNAPDSVDDYKGFICGSKQRFEKSQYFIIIIINIDLLRRYWFTDENNEYLQSFEVYIYWLLLCSAKQAIYWVAELTLYQEMRSCHWLDSSWADTIVAQNHCSDA